MTAERRPGGQSFDALDDKELMLYVQRDDDSAAFDALYERHYVAASRLAGFLCASCEPGCAAEAVQEGFLAVWRSRTRYRPEEGTVQSWILVLVRNRAFDMLRLRKRQLPVSHAPRAVDRLPSHQSVADDAEKADTALRLRTQLESLPAAQREVIELAYFGGLTHKEIAATLTLPAGTVKGRMRLGLDKLRITAVGD